MTAATWWRDAVQVTGRPGTTPKLILLLGEYAVSSIFFSLKHSVYPVAGFPLISLRPNLNLRNKKWIMETWALKKKKKTSPVLHKGLCTQKVVCYNILL